MNTKTETQNHPSVSVVIAVHNGGTDLDKCLAAVSASSYPVCECILVDDASTDGMVDPAAGRHGARVIRLEQQGGPANARNLGVKEAVGDIIFFTDADVLLHPDAIARAVDVLQSDAGIAAVIGSYDDQPGHMSFISQYRNLFHHWVHQTSAEEASTFWTGCGAIRRKVFLEMGGFSLKYQRPSIEDIELGMRMRHSGHRIKLIRDMYGKHMKYWSLLDVIRTDILMRAIPWMSLILDQGQLTNDLNLGYRSRIATVLAGLLAVVLLILVLTGHGTALLPVTGFLLAAAISARFSATTGRQHAAGIPALALTTMIPLIFYWLKPDPFAWAPMALLLTLVISHLDFYRYIAQKRNLAFAIGVIPMQLLFFLGCAVSIPLAFIQHRLGGRKQPVDGCSQQD